MVTGAGLIFKDAEDLGDADSPRTRCLKRYQQVRAYSEQLCAPLATEDYVVQSMPDASPVKWHLAHTSWFFDTFVLPKVGCSLPRNDEYAFLFNSYYNAVGPMHCRPKRGLISRPTVAEVLEYRRQIDARMSSLIADSSEQDFEKVASIVELGLHHEQQHQELLLTDVKHLFAQNPLYPIYCQKAQNDQPRSAAALEWLSFPEGLQWIGHEGNEFAFDNELPRHRRFVQAFQLASRPVTNAEFLTFIEDEGYQRPEFWLSLGWVTATENLWHAPLYWLKRQNQWWEFTLIGLRPLVPAEPVCHVSYFEADAYARWAGARLPTEAEWEVASETVPMKGNFTEAGHFHPQARGPAPGNGLQQMFGDVWEWTRSSYEPYPGYRPAAGAIGEYNGKFMCNQYVLRGGSCATAETHIRHTYRNFFAPEKRWQFMGIRLAKDAA